MIWWVGALTQTWQWRGSHACLRLHVSASAHLHVSASAHLHVSASACVCMCLHVSASACLSVALLLIFYNNCLRHCCLYLRCYETVFQFKSLKDDMLRERNGKKATHRQNAKCRIRRRVNTLHLYLTWGKTVVHKQITLLNEVSNALLLFWKGFPQF